MAVQEFKSHGITPDTPNNIVLGAGTIHSGLKYTKTYAETADETAQAGKTYYERTGTSEADYVYTVKDVEDSGSVAGLYELTGGSWNAAESILGATSGGNTFTIEPEMTDIEVDGAMVKVMGLAVKTNETATLETNLVELTPENFKLATNGMAGEGLPDYDEIKSRARIEKDAYIQNFGFVGKKINGEPIIIIFDYALCTSGLEWDAQAKEAGVLAATFECYAPIDGDLETLPWHIYTPKKQVQE